MARLPAGMAEWHAINKLAVQTALPMRLPAATAEWLQSNKLAGWNQQASGAGTQPTRLATQDPQSTRLAAQALDHDPLVHPGRGAGLEVVVADEAPHTAVVGGDGGVGDGRAGRSEHQLAGAVCSGRGCRCQQG